MPDGRRAPALFLLAVLLSAVPAAGQNNSAAPVEIPPAPPPRGDTVGPEQLRDFSLPGTVTRPAEPREAPPRTTDPVPAPSTASPQEQRPAAARTAPGRNQAATPSATVPAPATAAPLAPTAGSEGADPAPSLSLDLPPPTPAPIGAESGLAAPPAAVLPDSAAALEDTRSTLSLWPWLLAGLAVVSGALFWFRRRREAEAGRYGQLAFAGAAPDPAPAAPRPAPAPPPLRPASETPPAPPPVRPAAEIPPTAPPITGGIVSTRLRPWVDLEFAPVRAVLSDEEAVIEFDLRAVNSGSVPARDVVIEGVILNAGAEQEQELATFFARPQASADGIEAIPPLGRVPLRSQVRLPRAAVREYAAEDRRLFVPVVAFNAAYRWSGGTGRTSASFLVGLGQADAEKLGPLRVDQGPREWRGLAAKLLASGIRR